MAEPKLSASPATTPRWRLSQRSRTGLEAAIFVIALFFLGWGADSLARHGAESLLARNIQNATGVSERPVVHARGFAFLPQVVRGAFDEVDVTTVGITSGPLRIERVESQLYDVRVPFHDVLVQDIRRVGIGRSVEQATLTYTDINRYFAETGRPWTLAPADNGELTVTGEVDVLNRRLQVQALVSLSVSDETLRINPREISTGSTDLSKASRLLLGQRLSLSVPLGTLPFGQQLVDATTYPGGIALEARGTTIVIQP